MNTWFKNLPMLLLGGLALSACQEEVEPTSVEMVAAPELSVSTDNLTLDSERAEDEAITFTWTEADFGFPAAINYTLEMDIAGNDFSSPRTTNAEGTLSRTYTVAQFNAIATQLGLTSDSPEQIEARVSASVSSQVAPQRSAPAMINTLVYGTEEELPEYTMLYVPGEYQGWAPENAPGIASVEDDGNFEGYVYFADASEFKFTSAPSWDETNYGIGDSEGSLSTAGEAGNLSVDAAGYYRLQVDTEGMTWSSTLTTWGVIGDATGSWEEDQDMTFDPEAGVWRITLNLSEGELKFRANNEWNIDFGDNDADGMLNYGGANIAVESAGEYEIILDLSNAGNYTYALNAL